MDYLENYVYRQELMLVRQIEVMHQGNHQFYLANNGDGKTLMLGKKNFYLEVLRFF